MDKCIDIAEFINDLDDDNISCHTSNSSSNSSKSSNSSSNSSLSSSSSEYDDYIATFKNSL